MRIHSGVPGLGDSGTYDLEKYIPDKYFVNLVTFLIAMIVVIIIAALCFAECCCCKKEDPEIADENI